MTETLSIISIVSFAAAGMFAVVATALWFLFKIPSVINDLSGKNAKSSVEQMRKNNKMTGDKFYKPGITNLLDDNATKVLATTDLLNVQRKTGGAELTMLDEVILINTDEVIV